MNIKKIVLFATHNPAKIKRFLENVKLQNCKLVSPQDLDLPKIDPEENGSSELENAKIKATAYFEISKVPSISLDTGFYVEGLQDSEQPGKHVQRIAGVLDTDSDEERFEKMSKYYTDIAKKFGGTAEAYFKDVFCVYNGKQYFYAEARREALLTTKIYQKDVHFPIASVYKIPRLNNKYYHQLNPEEMLDYIKPSILAVQSVIMDNFGEIFVG
jgi:XTP/dITP diphosphohydrolase